MSLPKEPRQKMINIMYLVLTAMLALNVSSEILNAFKTVNKSLDNANGIIENKNQTIFVSFEKMIEDPRTKDKALIYKPEADKVKRLADDVYNYIDALKTELKKEAGLKIENGEEKFAEENLEASTRLFDTKGKGSELLKKLTEFKTNVLGVDTAINAQFKNALPLDLAIPKSKSGNSKMTWTTAYFHMTPTVAALTILSKFQNDVKNSEASIVDFLHSKVGEVKVQYDQFAAIASADKAYAMEGDEIHITAGVGSFSAAAKPTITINGSYQNLQPDGTVVYATKATGVGEHTVTVNIELTKPDGTKYSVPKIVKYTVGLPSGASIFLEKMNVAYIGVDNPITISGGSVGSEKVNVSFTGGGDVKNLGGGKYIINPTTTGEQKLIVDAAGKKFPFPIRCKYLPNPVAVVSEKQGGAISAAEFKAQGGLIAKLVESDFDARFQVISYRLGAYGGSVSSPLDYVNNGPRWTGDAASLVGRASPGTKIYFD
ncbi:MAG TPA: gliding motility protein GldM, partial [Chitinophagaceae bacterium]|nr:gliding motility protein GldM [Chitinophagaceae bacterium]